VDEEINGIKTLYEDREKTISNERDDALAKLIAMEMVKFFCFFNNALCKLIYYIHFYMSSLKVSLEIELSHESRNATLHLLLHSIIIFKTAL